MRVAWQRVGLAPAQAGERQHKPKREDGSGVSRKRQAAGRASYYQGEREFRSSQAASVTTSESITAWKAVDITYSHTLYAGIKKTGIGSRAVVS